MDVDLDEGEQLDHMLAQTRRRRLAEAAAQPQQMADVAAGLERARAWALEFREGVNAAAPIVPNESLARAWGIPTTSSAAAPVAAFAAAPVAAAPQGSPAVAPTASAVRCQPHACPLTSPPLASHSCIACAALWGAHGGASMAPTHPLRPTHARLTHVSPH